MADDFDPATKFRSLTGAARAIETTLVLALTLVAAAWAGEVHVFLNLTFFKEQFLGLFFALGGVDARVAVLVGGGFFPSQATRVRARQAERAVMRAEIVMARPSLQRACQRL